MRLLDQRVSKKYKTSVILMQKCNCLMLIYGCGSLYQVGFEFCCSSVGRFDSTVTLACFSSLIFRVMMRLSGSLIRSCTICCISSIFLFTVASCLCIILGISSNEDGEVRDSLGGSHTERDSLGKYHEESDSWTKEFLKKIKHQLF